MSLFFWKKNKHIDMFADMLAKSLYSFAQPELASDYLNGKGGKNEDKKTRKKIDALVDDIARQINQFKITNSVGIYGKARLHMKFTERLKELGYDEMTAKKFNEILMLKTP